MGASGTKQAEPGGPAKVEPSKAVRAKALADSASDEEAWVLSGWVESLPVSKLISMALLPPTSTAEHLEYAKTLSYERVKQMLNEADIVETLAKAVAQGSAQLKETSTLSELNQKFASEASFELAVGNLDVFFSGLEGLVGPPRMVDGSIRSAMEADHCTGPEADDRFTSSNGLTSTARDEWEFVVHPVSGKEYPERKGFREQHPDKARRPTPLAVFCKKMREQNRELEDAGHTPLVEEEVVCARLYTGPMYEKYNIVLRFKGSEKCGGTNAFLQGRFAELCKGNEYPTTLHAINSCIIKASKLMKATRIYRGSTRAKLPKEFLHANEQTGVKGGIEFGFTSTTSQREQAMHYAQGAASTVFEMDMGMIDRGADVSWLSQYRHESEILFPPLMGIQVLGMRVEGGTLVVEARLSLNLMSLTLEQVIGRRKKLLHDMGGALELEVRKGLATRAADAATNLVQLELRKTLDKEPDTFNVDVHFQSAVAEALKTKRSVQLATLLQKLGGEAGKLTDVFAKVQPLQGNVVDLSGLNLTKGSADSLLVIEWVKSGPDGLTRLLLKAEVGADVLDALCELAVASKTLVDVSENDANLNVMLLRGVEAVETIDLSSRGLGPVSGAIIASCLRENSVLKSMNLLFNNLTVEGAALIVKVFRELRHIKSLCGFKPDQTEAKLSGKQLKDADAVLIAADLEFNPVLNTLSLMSNKIGDAGAAAIAEGLSVNRVLTTLRLDMNQIGSTGATAIAEALKFNRALNTLNLKGNNIGLIGATAIAEALKFNRALKELYLWSNNIGDAGAAAIAEGLSVNRALKELYLGANQIGPVGAKAIGDALLVNPVLNTLGLTGNRISGTSKQALRDVVQGRDGFNLYV